MFDTRPLAAFQHDFLAAVAAPPTDAPAGLRVHHDTWFFGLIEALRNRLELTAQALGEDAFNAFARDYIATHALTSGDRNGYGEDFPGFVRSHPEAAAIPWLADLAALELALDRAHHAADAVPCALEDLMAPDAVCALHPSVSVLCLDYDIAPLHTALQSGTVPEPPHALTCDLLIGRAADDTVVRLCLAPLEARFLALIMEHRSLFAALDALSPDDNDLVLLQMLLARLVQNQLLIFN
jgi:hypothetical protein